MPSVRDTFFNKIYSMVESGEDIFVLSSDLGAPSLDDFRKNYPERFINVGIAEQCLIAMAAGLVEAGKKVVAYGLNPFPMTRAFDQFRCLMGEMKIPVTLCALNAGICSAAAGYTHMATEVFAMARMVPNVKIYYPSDETISEILAEKTLNFDEPRYILFDKIAGGKIYSDTALDFEKGYSLYQPGKDYGVGLIGNSSHTKMLRSIADQFAEKNISVTVFDVFSVPLDEKVFVEDLKKCSHLLTVEENVLQGGLGSYVLEILSDNHLNISIKRLGIDFKDGVPNVFMDRDYLRKLNGLDEAGIVSALNKIFEKLES